MRILVLFWFPLFVRRFLLGFHIAFKGTQRVHPGSYSLFGYLFRKFWRGHLGVFGTIQGEFREVSNGNIQEHIRKKRGKLYRTKREQTRSILLNSIKQFIQLPVTKLLPGFYHAFSRCLPGFYQAFTRLLPGFYQVFTRFFLPGFYNVFIRFVLGFPTVVLQFFTVFYSFYSFSRLFTSFYSFYSCVQVSGMHICSRRVRAWRSCDWASSKR